MPHCAFSSFAYPNTLSATMSLAGSPDHFICHGKLGSGTRAVVKKEQIKIGWSADSYPTPEFITKLTEQYVVSAWVEIFYFTTSN